MDRMNIGEAVGIAQITHTAAPTGCITPIARDIDHIRLADHMGTDMGTANGGMTD